MSNRASFSGVRLPPVPAHSRTYELAVRHPIESFFRLDDARHPIAPGGGGVGGEEVSGQEVQVYMPIRRYDVIFHLDPPRFSDLGYLKRYSFAALSQMTLRRTFLSTFPMVR